MAEEKPDKDQNTQKLRDHAEALLSQARAQLADLQRALGAIVGDSELQSRLAAVAAQISGAIGALSQALQSPGSALRPADLSALEAVVHSTETTSLLTEAAAQTGATAAQIAAVAAASAATRAETQTLAADVFDRHVFDPYLHFTSREDEAEFREREDEARKYVAAQLARHTPEGDLNAGGGMLGTMLDAHAHGAGDSPDFMPRWNALVEKTQKQRAAMQAAGQSTEEFDRNLDASTRRFLKTKGLSDAEIDARLARSANPLDAVKPFITSDEASQNLGHAMEEHRASTTAALPRVVAVEAAPPVADPPRPADFDPFAKLKAAGVQVTDTADSGHGLTVQKPTGKAGPDVAG
jgi:hypothetical protein